MGRYLDQMKTRRCTPLGIRQTFSKFRIIKNKYKKKEVMRASLLKGKLNVERYVEDPYEVDQHGD
jgi:hypothetical protein